MSNLKKKFLAYFLIILIPFSFLFFRFPAFESLRIQVVEVSKVPIQVILFPFREIKKIFLYRSTFNGYVRLKEELDILRQQLVGQEELSLENNRLRELLDFKEGFVYSSMAANIIGRDPTNWSSSILVDKGKKDGIKIGMPVVNAVGVIGKVSEVGSTTSRVLLITDPNFSVAALIQRNRESGLISGTLQGICRMRYINYDADIRVGDRVITSKMSSTFPEGLLVGVVTSVAESQSSPSLEAVVRPEVYLTRIEEVLIILEK